MNVEPMLPFSASIKCPPSLAMAEANELSARFISFQFYFLFVFRVVVVVVFFSWEKRERFDCFQGIRRGNGRMGAEG